MTWTATQLIQDRYELLTLKRDRPGHQVWLALDQQSQAKVILKTLAFTGQIQWDEVKLFEREIAVLKRLKHPQLPSFVDAFNLEQPHFQKCLVETYIHAPTLQAFLDRKQSIPLAQIWAIATQVLTILIDLHSLEPPILHRDLKPSNILIDSNKTVYLIDLGSVGIQAAAHPDAVDIATTVGSYGYTPMEQFMGQGTMSSDLYALGAILLELLTETHPSELMTPQLRLAVPDSFALAAPLRQWLNHLTEPDVANRISTANQALQGLQQAQNLTRAIAAERQALSPVSSVGRRIKRDTDHSLTITVEPVWNRQTIAMGDLLILFALAALPAMVGVGWAIALRVTSQGFDRVGMDLLLVSLGLLPSLLIAPKLLAKVLEQEAAFSPSQLILKRKISGIPFQTIRINQRDVTRFKLSQHAEGWKISAICALGTEKTLLIGLSALEIDDIFQDLEQWRLFSNN